MVGSGSELDNVKKLVSELKTDNVIFYGQRPIEDMPKLYKIADAMLVTLKDKPYVNMTIPGKVQSYMAIGKPVIGSINGSCFEFITTNGIGYCCEAEDFNQLANIIKSLEYKNLIKIGKIAKQIYFDKYSKASFISELQSNLEKFKK